MRNTGILVLTLFLHIHWVNSILNQRDLLQHKHKGSIDPPCLKKRKNILLSKRIITQRGSSSTQLSLPDCDKEGFYNPVQCDNYKNLNNSSCWCVDKCGKEINGTKRPGGNVSCEPVGPCAIARKLAQETDHLPFCDEDGFFSKEQCSGSECWCCDKCGNELHGTKAAPWEMPSCSCPTSNRDWSCKINPCENSSCASNPKATCRPSYCGGCRAEFFDGTGNLVNCGNEKSGKCPALPKEFVGSCDTECSFDSDCPGDLKCCANGCGKICMSSEKTVKAGKCPPIKNSRTCTSFKHECNGDEDCTGSTKCCSSGCHRICVAPYERKDTEQQIYFNILPPYRPRKGDDQSYSVKPGQCPIVNPQKTFSCKEECVHDNQCTDNKKCCDMGCGHSCVVPHVIEKHGICPASSTSLECEDLDLEYSVDECLADMDCNGMHKCCNTSCGRHCLNPFRNAKSGYCPLASNNSNTSGCRAECDADKDCNSPDICCADGCNKVCSKPILKGCIDRQGKRHFEGDVWYIDACHICQCLGNISVCISSVCNTNVPDGCVAEYIPGACCPVVSCGIKDTKHSDIHNETCTDATSQSIHFHGESWHLDHCTHCRCLHGYISCSTITCPEKPRIGCIFKKRKGKCCPEMVCQPTCIDHEGYKRNDGDVWYEDTCTQCKCKNGIKQCNIETCPPIGKKCRAFKIPGRCCPEVKCLPSKAGKSCFAGRYMHMSGDHWTKDSCTMCSCFNGKIKCQFETCENYNKSVCYSVPAKRKCCAELYCTMKESLSCSSNGKTYYNGEIWQEDQCKRCLCRKGAVHCDVIACEETKPGCTGIYVPGKCCPNVKCLHHTTGNLICIEDGIVHPHGDTWYREPCKQCHCHSGRITCTIRDCPKLSKRAGCHTSHPTGECCLSLICRPKKSHCTDIGNSLRYHEEEWDRSSCIHCRCEHGRISCVSEVCPAVRDGCTVKRSLGKCCPDVSCPDKTGWCLPVKDKHSNPDQNYKSECIVDADCPNTKKCCQVGSRAQKCLLPILLNCVDQKGVMRHYGDRWYEDDCKLCECLNTNATHCIRIPERCPQVKPGCVEIEVEDQCCPDIECDSDVSLKKNDSCFYGNETYENGEHWMEDDCTACTCRSGTLKCITIKCPVTPGRCRPVYKAGKCCPEVVCREGHSCTVGKRVYLDQESWVFDECTHCRCDHGQSWCTKKKCNVPLQPGCRYVKVTGQCCPNVVCDSDRRGKKSCQSGGGYSYNHGEIWVKEPCVTCSCDDGHIVCTTTSCPVIRGADCRIEEVPGQCCPNIFCRQEKSCIYEGVVHLNGERWSVSECVSCECLHGQSICEWTKCPSAPEGCLAERMPGQCCPNIRCPGTLYDPRSCRDYKRKIHHHGDQWAINFGCTFCQCLYGNIKCQHKSCQPVAYRPGCYQIQYEDMCCPDIICGDTKPGHCPFPDASDEQSCINQCHSDKDCNGTLKCCGNGCGKECMQPQWKVNSALLSGKAPRSAKPGKCPSPSFTDRCIGNGHKCRQDDHCPYLEKCCFNGCHFECTDPNNNEQCLLNQPEVMCFSDPCKSKKCPGFPNAICKISKCGSCKGVFYDKDGKEVECKNAGDLTHKCPIPNNVCGNNCNENSDCPANYSCCPNTCGNSCVKNIDLDCIDASGIMHRHGSIWKRSPCQICTCIRSAITCWRQTCTPVPPGCFAEPQIRQCCPRVVCPYETRCIENINSISTNITWKSDFCTRCQCNGNTPTCFATVCRAPAKNWNILQNPEYCCPDLHKQGCVDHNGVTRQHKENWSPDPCQKCHCEHGQTRCRIEKCYTPGIGCYAVRREAQCCSEIICPKESAPCHEARKQKYGTLDSEDELWPSCDDNGYFLSVQCNSSSNFCWCVNNWGIEYPNTRVKNTLPTCAYLPPLEKRTYFKLQKIYHKLQSQATACNGFEKLIESLQKVEPQWRIPSSDLGYRPCFSDLHKQLLRMDRQSLRQSYVPQCTNDGKYQTQQCDPMQKKCWCVEEDGTEIEGTRKVGDAHCGCRDAFGVLRNHGEVFSYDSCRTCRCNHGNIQCDVTFCAQVAHNGCKQQLVESQCCPSYICVHSCIDLKGVRRKIGESWKPDGCTKCTCENGKISCRRRKCLLQRLSHGCYPVPSLNKCCDDIVCDEECPVHLTVAKCPVHPCKGIKCHSHPDAVCKASFCGSCKAEFVDRTTSKPVNCQEETIPFKRKRRR